MEKIGDYSFAYKQKLVNVYLPVTTKTLGTYAFQSCTKLESINTQNIEEFNNDCFQYCSALKEIYLSEFVTKLGTNMFENCTNLKTIYCYCDKALITSNTFHSYGFDVVYCDYSGEAENGSAYTLKDGVLNIVQFHPYGDSTLNSAWYTDNVLPLVTSVIFPENITQIPTRAFSKAYSIKRIDVPTTVKEMAGATFHNCRNLEILTLPEGLTALPSEMCSGCSKLNNVIVPSTVTSIANRAFIYNSAMTTLTLLSKVPPTLEKTNAISTATTTIRIPAGTLSAYQTATNWSSFADKFVELPAE